MEVRFYEKVADELLDFAVIVAKARGKWVFCKHRERDTYEVPGGHREPGESIWECACRELYEETGAVSYHMEPVSVYSVTDGPAGAGETFGMLYYAEIVSFEEELHSEIEKIILTEQMVEAWTYPQIQPLLMQQVQKQVKKLEFVSKEFVDKGWSADKKYKALTADGSKYLLRITPAEKSSNRPEMFRLQKKVAELGINMCSPIEFGTCAEGVYTVQTWIDGVDAEAMMPCFRECEQYDYGYEAGRTLRRIHSIPAPEGQPDWEMRFNRKMDRKIEMYRECPVQFEGAEHMIAYIEANRHLLKNRPQSFQHGDYHIGNMMIEKGRLVIIDFDRFDYGDPWEEFNRIVWCAQKVPVFATGMVEGYFGGAVPEEFWKLLALYISSNMLSSIPWAIPFGEKEINTMLNQAKDVLAWYDNMKNPIPTWYRGN